MDALHRFVPRFARRRALGTAPLSPELDAAVSGALFVADIAGFSALTEHKARAGQAGMEEMQAILNHCFERIVSTIEGGGGEVFKFAGDATIAWWRASGADLHDAAQNAAATALRLQALVPELATALDVPLSLRICIGAGPLFTAIVGGVDGRWETVLGGEALRQVAAMQAVPSGQVALSRDAWELLRADCSGEPQPDGGFVVYGVTPPMPFERRPAEPEPSTAQLTPLVPRHLVQRLVANKQDTLAELRSATVQFVRMAVPGDLDTLQRCTEAIQRCIYDAGGSVLQCLVDDTGAFVAVAAWGIPGSSYSDDAERALRAGHAVAAAMADNDREVSVGVASGRLFAGVRGSSSRAEFALIGAVVNRAARLAQAAAGCVCCDEATARAVPAVAFVERPAVVLKGIGAVKVFDSRGQRRIDLSNAQKLIGRDAEHAILLTALQRVVDDPTRSAAVLVEGEAGIGKSHLCAAFAQVVQKRGLVLATGASDPLNDSAAYRPLRTVFDTLLGLQGESSSTRRRERVLALLDANEATRERASLLTHVLNLDLPPSATEQQMSGRGRIEATTELLVQLLSATDAGAARVVLLEDLHWLDSASWGVLEQAVRHCPGLLLVLSSRPLAVEAAHSALFQEPNVTRLRLAPLDETAVRAIIASELGVAVVPEPVLQAVADKTQGLPLFVRQVVASLVDRQIVRSAAGVLSYDAQALANLAIPDTIQGVVISRIDRLTPRQQATLKAASVVGQVFTLDALGSTDVGRAGAGALGADVDVLVDSGLVERSADGYRFHFSHALVRDAVYSLLPFAYRRELHAALGAWCERQSGTDPLMLARIANHWALAHDLVRAPRALENAGTHALRTGTYREAQSLFTRLIEIATRGFGDGSTQLMDAGTDKLASWHLNLGLSSYTLGEVSSGRAQLETAAALLADRVPSELLIGPALVVEAARAVARRWFRRRAADTGEGARERLAAKALDTLGNIYLVSQLPRHTMYAIVRRFNLLDQRAACSEQMAGLGGMMYLTTVLGRHRLADTYAARLVDVHRRVQDPLAYAAATLPVALAYLGQARWEPCERWASEAEQILHRLGERHSRMLMVATLANAAELQGAFARSEQLYTLAGRLAADVGDQVGEGRAAGGLAMVAIRQGRHEEAAAQARRSVPLAQAGGETVAYFVSIGSLALSLFEAGELPAARELVDEGIALLAALPRLVTAHHLLNGLDTFSELILRLWEHEAPPRGSAAWRQWSRHAALATTRMSAYARRFPIGAPMAAQRLALQHWLHGRQAKAMAAWQHAIAEGQRTQIPYETAKAHLELASHLNAGSAQRRQHAAEAVTIFERIGAHGALRRARALV
jgi:class 3 adenylate cyclase/tetratricopeptide (TPR) repeat protein